MIISISEYGLEVIFLFLTCLLVNLCFEYVTQGEGSGTTFSKIPFINRHNHGGLG